MAERIPLAEFGNIFDRSFVRRISDRHARPFVEGRDINQFEE